MTKQELWLWGILRCAAKGNELPEDDLAFAESCLETPPPQAQANACEILFRCSRSEPTRCRALDTVEQLCDKASEEDYVVTILIVMLYIPLDAFSDRPTLREFTFKCGSSNSWQIRTNAVSVLQRVATRGDRNALQLLQYLASDSNRWVSENARNAIHSLGESA